jgi:hypothetical protein
MLVLHVQRRRPASAMLARATMPCTPRIRAGKPAPRLVRRLMHRCWRRRWMPSRRGGADPCGRGPDGRDRGQRDDTPCNVGRWGWAGVVRGGRAEGRTVEIVGSATTLHATWDGGVWAHRHQDKAAAERKVLPLPLRVWAAKRTKAGGRGWCLHRPDVPCASTPPPNLGPIFAAQARKGRGRIFLGLSAVLMPMGLGRGWSGVVGSRAGRSRSWEARRHSMQRGTVGFGRGWSGVVGSRAAILILAETSLPLHVMAGPEPAIFFVPRPPGVPWAARGWPVQARP